MSVKAPAVAGKRNQSIVQDVVEFLDPFVGIFAASKAGVDILDPFNALP
jgi:hypothetical protein